MKPIKSREVNTSDDQRRRPDRRKNKFKAFFCSFYMGRRRTVRRKEEEAMPFYTDVYEKWEGLVFISIMVLSSLDAFLTLRILERGGKELNPMMLALLEMDDTVFFFGKLALTLFCLLFVLVHINFRLLNVVTMRQVLVTFFITYIFLIGYEGHLLSI